MDDMLFGLGSGPHSQGGESARPHLEHIAVECPTCDRTCHSTHATSASSVNGNTAPQQIAYSVCTFEIIYPSSSSEQILPSNSQVQNRQKRIFSRVNWQLSESHKNCTPRYGIIDKSMSTKSHTINVFCPVRGIQLISNTKLIQINDHKTTHH